LRGHGSVQTIKAIFPEIGEDIKVMAYRQGRRLTLTIALAFVDPFHPE
jgi:S-adenosylmethionine synthetase